jgi:hypothetical protein
VASEKELVGILYESGWVDLVYSISRMNGLEGKLLSPKLNVAKEHCLRRDPDRRRQIRELA